MTRSAKAPRVNINAHGTRWREAVGNALHEAAHPSHPWSGCGYPDAIYDKWMPRFIVALERDGYEIALIATPTKVAP